MFHFHSAFGKSYQQKETVRSLIFNNSLKPDTCNIYYAGNFILLFKIIIILWVSIALLILIGGGACGVESVKASFHFEFLKSHSRVYHKVLVHLWLISCFVDNNVSWVALLTTNASSNAKPRTFIALLTVLNISYGTVLRV